MNLDMVDRWNTKSSPDYMEDVLVFLEYGGWLEVIKRDIQSCLYNPEVKDVSDARGFELDPIFVQGWQI